MALFDTLAEQSTRAVLKVNGRSYNSWKSISIKRSLTQLSGEFTFTTANRFSGNNRGWGITSGDECTVDVANQRVITGYVDTIEDGYTNDSHDISFSGRDKTADLIDCSFDIFENGNEFKNLTPFQIVNKLVTPFDVTLKIDPLLYTDPELLKSIDRYNVEPGEPVYESIALICQQYAILPISDGFGNLLLTRAGIVPALDMLQVGVNILSNKLNQSDKSRFSKYCATGPVTESVWLTNTAVKGVALDNYVKRTRPLVIMVGEQAIGDSTCQKRASWEARVRAGASRKIDTTVRGWTQKLGPIWPLNSLIQMNDNKIGVSGSFLIVDIELNLDASGELTNLTLVPPDTFEANKQAVPNKKVSEFDKLADIF